MSSVDERIVEMRFENDQFEKGVTTSLKTLDKLKAGLNLDGAANSLNNLQTSANNLDISHISDGVDKITDRFSILGIMIDQVARRATDGLIQLGTKVANVVESLTIDQIPVGFNKYERKVNSVQTIMNATSKDIDTVSKSLDKLNWYTDETSYSYTDMVDNIGKFTSSGVLLDEAVTSMIGIANAAGYAGANVQDASHAMEGFSKAMGQGYMSRQNWQWIRTAHMDTVKFKEQMIEAAVAEKTLAKVTKKVNGEYKNFYYVANKNGKPIKNLAVSVEDFETNLAKGWLTKGTMNRALSEYGKFTEDIYQEYLQTGDLTSDIIERLDDGTENLGLKAFRASQEAKTFSDAINSVKDAVSTGWMVSFEQIFGNYEETKKLWTNVANELWDVFNGDAERRNDMLKAWHDQGGYKMLWKSISNIWEGTKAIGEAVKGVFEQFFPPMTTERLMKFTKKLSEFSIKFKNAFTFESLEELPKHIEQYLVDDIAKHNNKVKKNLSNITNAFSGLFSIIKLGTTVFKSFLQIVSPLRKVFKSLGSSLFDLVGNTGEYITKLVETIITSEKYKKVVDTLTNYVDKFANFILKAKDHIHKFIDALKRNEVIKKFFDKIRDGINDTKNKLIPYVDKAKRKINEFFKIFSNNKEINYDQIINNLIDGFVKFKQKVTEAYEAIKDFFAPTMDVLNSIYQKIKPHIEKVTNKIKQFWDNMIVGKQLGPYIVSLFGKFKTKFDEMCKAAKSFIENFSFKDLWNNVKNFFSPIMDKIDKWIEDVKTKLENLDLGKLAAAGITLAIIPTIIAIAAAFSEAAKLLKSTKGFVNNLSSLITKFKSGFKTKLVEVAKAVTMFAAAIGILAASFKLISTVDADKVQSSLNVLKWFGGGLAGITAVLGLMGRFNLLGNIQSVGLALIELSGALVILSSSFLILDKANPENVTKNLMILVTLSALLMTISGLLGKFVPEMTKGSLGMVSFASSILLLTMAVQKMSEVDTTRFSASLGAVAMLISMMAAVALLGGQVKFGSGIGLLGLVGGILLLVKLFEKLSDETIATLTEKAQKNLVFIAGTIGALIALALVARLGGDHASKTGTAILAMAASVLLIYEAIKKLGNMDTAVLLKGGIAVAAILAFFTLLSKSTMYAGQSSGKAGFAILAMAASLLVIYLAVKRFGQMNPQTMVKGLMGVIPILVTFGLAIRSLRNLKGVSGATGALIGVAIVVGTIAATLAYLSLFSWDQLKTSIVALAGTVGALLWALRVASGAKFDRSSVAGLVAGVIAIGAIGYSIGNIAKFNWKDLAGAAGGISACLLALAGAMRIVAAGDFKQMGWDQFLTIAVGLAVMWVIGQILANLADKPWESFLATSTAMSKLLIVLGGVGTGMAFAAMALGACNFGLLMAGLGYLMIAIVSVAATFYGMAYLIDLFSGKGADFENGAKIMGNAIGAFVGGVIGNGVAEAAKRMEDVGTSLTKFMKNAGEFFDGLSNIPPGVGTNLFDLTRALTNFSKMGKDIKSGKDLGLDEMAGQLEQVSVALKTFGENSAGINLANIQLAVDAGNMLNTLLSSLSGTGGLAQKIFGEKEWATLIDGLVGTGDKPGLCNALVEISKHDSSDINIKNIQHLVDAATPLKELLEALPETGGFVQKFTGELTWDVISNGLENFGNALVKLSENGPSKINLTNIQNAVAAGTELNNLLKALPEEPTKLKKFFSGSEGPSWSVISTGLQEFGEAMTTFSGIVVGKFDADFVIAVNRIKNIPDVFVLLNDTMGNDAEMSSVTGSIRMLSDALYIFNEQASKLKTENIGKAVEFVTGINGMVEQLSGVGEKIGSGFQTALLSVLSPDNAISAATSYISALSGALSNTYDVSTAGYSVADAISAGVSSAVKFMSDIGLDYVGGLAEAINYNAPLKALPAGIGLAGQVISGLTGGAVAQAAEKAGNFIGDGFVAGIKAKNQAAYNAGVSLGNSAIEGARNATDENSPSRVFMQIGEYCGQGLAIGFNNSTANVRAASVKLAEESLNASAETLKGFDNLSELNISSQPVITPVLDLTQVDLQAQKLNSILNGSAAVSLSGRINTDRRAQNIDDLILVSSAILEEIREGHDLYFDDGAFAGRINRRLGVKI